MYKVWLRLINTTALHFATRRCHRPWWRDRCPPPYCYRCPAGSIGTCSQLRPATLETGDRMISSRAVCESVIHIEYTGDPRIYHEGLEKASLPALTSTYQHIPAHTSTCQVWVMSIFEVVLKAPSNASSVAHVTTWNTQKKKRYRYHWNSTISSEVDWSYNVFEHRPTWKSCIL